MVAAAMALGIVTGNAVPARAQDSTDDSPNLLLLGVKYGAPDRLSGTVSGLFPYGRFNPERNAITNALEIRGRLGTEGYGVSIGQRWMSYGPFGPEAMLTVTRTFASPLQANGHATYVGMEVGYQTLGHISIGIARQVDGPSDQRDTRLTWSVGVQIPYGFWRW